MEVLSTDYNSFHPVTPEKSPVTSPSTSPIPDQRLSPQNMSRTEQSLHVIVEPNIDGQTNMIYLMNPLTGQILSSFVAEHGAHIEIQQGVFFRVPFPHEHGYHPFASGIGMHHQHATYQPQIMHNTNVIHAQNINDNANNYTLYPNIPCQQYNPQCPLHGSPGSNDASTYQNVSKDERLDKRREKLQKKLREKRSSQSHCTCYMYPMQNHISTKPPHDNHQEHNHIENSVNEELLSLSPKGQAISPYAIEIRWDESLQNEANHTQNHPYIFELQQLCKGNKFKTIYNGSDSHRIVRELSPGTEYSFRVCAILNAHYGPYSELVTCKTFCCVPDRPAPPRIAQKTKNFMILKWTMPSDGGSPITQYTLQWCEGDGDKEFTDLYVGLQKQFKHSHKLPPGTLCSFRLQASNSIGSSEYSQILECLTSSTPPSVPSPPIMSECGTDFIRLRWTEPESLGSVVDEYKLEMEDPNDGYGFMVKYCGDAKSFACKHLRRNCYYKFRLSASNSQGSSKYSTPVVYSTLPEPPGKMERPRINGKAKPFSLPVKWDIPKDTGGDDINGFTLEIDDGNGGDFVRIYSGSDKEYVVDNLLPGTTYRFRVAAESKAGRGMWSPVSNITTIPICPKDSCAPRLAAKPEMFCFHIQWDSPVDNGGAEINKYIVKMSCSVDGEYKDIYCGPAQNYFVKDLEPGTDYYFKTQSINSAGASPWSSISSLRTAPGPPDAPSLPTVIFKSPTYLKFDWDVPVVHGCDVTSYTIEKLENEVFQKVFQGAAQSCEVKKNIQPASFYYFRMQAHSDAGSSVYSNILTVETPPAVPGPVTDIKIVEQTSSSCLVQWRHPLEHGSPVYEYVLEATGITSLLCTVPRPKPTISDTSPVTSVDAIRDKQHDNSYDSDEASESEESDDELNTSSTYADSEASSSTTSKHTDDLSVMEYRLTGLTADASYRLRIQAINQIGAGPFSHGVQFFTKELPPPPPTLTAASTSYHSIKLKWSDSSSSSKKTLAVLSHTLQLQTKNGSFTSVYSGMGTSFTLNKLKELTSYCCRIRSKNDAGEGEFSKAKIFYTKAQPPNSVKDFKCSKMNEDSLELSWSSCDKIRGDDWLEYLVQQAHEENTKDFIQIFRGKANKCTVNGLKPNRSYRFRVLAIRHLSESVRSSVSASVPEEIKSVPSAILRVKTLSEEELIENEDVQTTDVTMETRENVRFLSDTHIALIILGSFLGICALVAVLLNWVLKDFY